jgi:hypothetical protein
MAAALGVACASGGSAVGNVLPGRTNCELAGPPDPDPGPFILFGDLHAHSSNSLDAQVNDLPVVGGHADRDPRMRCRFARYCSQLDFWALVDHAEEQTADQWQENLEAVRECNDLFGGYSHGPDLVSFLGWEWTPNTDAADQEWGHRNVVLPHTCDADVPARPIASASGFVGIDQGTFEMFGNLLAGLDPDNAELYSRVVAQVTKRFEKPACDPATDTLALPPGCHETAGTLEELFARLARWDAEVLVVPHGLSWGSNDMPQAGWDNQLAPARQDDRFVRVVEVYSGHGASEAHRAWSPVATAGDGSLSCPDPSTDYEPCCWRAGEIVRGRNAACKQSPEGAECAAVVDAAKQAFVDAGRGRYKTVPDAHAGDWLDCGQDRTGFQPARDFRPAFATQTALATTRFDDPAHPWRFRFGMIGSTDSHRAGPGAGYKEFKRMTDGSGASGPDFEAVVDLLGSLVVNDFERQGAYYFAGGLVAVHAAARARDSIWKAIRDRRVYATSGDRIELWFDLANAPGGGRLPMGSEAVMAEAPRFEVKAVGSRRQSPGCPDWVRDANAPGFVDDVCFGECYNPTQQRRRIIRIEVVRIMPQVVPDEPLAPLIDDPFVILPCDAGAEACTVSFTDPDFPARGRPATYYVRAIQEPTPQVNADGLRCTTDAQGRCLDVRPCRHGFDATADDCLGSGEERAWSSPIYLDPVESRRGS